MDIYDYLKADHKKVKMLFKQFEKTKDPVYKTELVAMITKELTVHAKSEEATFYKMLEEFEQSKDIAEHGEEEHKDIEEALEAVVNANKTGAGWEKKVKRLEKVVDHHVKEEEGKMFRKAKKVLTQEEAYAIKEKMHDFKEKMLRILDK